jgi:hypothetical protein
MRATLLLFLLCSAASADTIANSIIMNASATAIPGVNSNASAVNSVTFEITTAPDFVLGLGSLARIDIGFGPIFEPFPQGSFYGCGNESPPTTCDYAVESSFTLTDNDGTFVDVRGAYYFELQGSGFGDNCDRCETLLPIGEYTLSLYVNALAIGSANSGAVAISQNISVSSDSPLDVLGAPAAGVTAIPEPGTWLTCAVSVGALYGVNRLRRRMT